MLPRPHRRLPRPPYRPLPLVGLRQQGRRRVRHVDLAAPRPDLPAVDDARVRPRLGPARRRERRGLAGGRSRLRGRHRDVQRARARRTRYRALPPTGRESCFRLVRSDRERGFSISSSETRTSRAASPSGTNESLLVTRATRPSKPASTSSAMTPSETPPVRRVSSTTSTRPVAFASRRMSSTGSGASQRRSSTRARIPRGEPPCDAQRQVEPVRPGHDREVVAVEVRARGADGHVLVGERATQPSSPSSCRSREW